MTEIKYRVVIKYLAKESLIAKIIMERLDGIYGQNSPFYFVVMKRAKRFHMSKESLEDDPKPERPVDVITKWFL